MVVVFEGDAENSIPAPQAAAYSAAVAILPGSRTSEQQAVVTAVDAKFAKVTNSWSTIQQAASAEVLTFGANVQADLTRVLRQYAPPGRERAYDEMFSVVTARLIEMYRVVVESRERLDAAGL